MKSIFSRVTVGLLGMKRGEWKWKFILVRQYILLPKMDGQYQDLVFTRNDIIWRSPKIIENDDMEVYL